MDGHSSLVSEQRPEELPSPFVGDGRFDECRIEDASNDWPCPTTFRFTARAVMKSC